MFLLKEAVIFIIAFFSTSSLFFGCSLKAGLSHSYASQKS
jgi:hypothetical protein